MTCIVGIVSDGNVWIGGDSAGVAGLSHYRRKDPKVFRNGEFIFGFTSSFRMGQLLAHAFKPPARYADQDVYAYMVVDFINALRDSLKAGGYAEKKNDQESAGAFLVGYQGRLFHIDSDYQVGENIAPFDACGCGDHLALGAMHATAGLQPEERLKKALAAAEEFSAGVSAPFTILSLMPPPSGGSQRPTGRRHERRR